MDYLTADAKLYTLYTEGLTGATEVRQIGWDRLSISGGTLYGSLKVNDTLTANTIHTTYIYDKNNNLGLPGQVLSTTVNGVEWINVTGTTNGGSVACTVDTASTYGLEYKKITTISGLTQGSYIIKSYLSSFSGNTKYGFWERTLGVVTTGGTPVIVETTEDFDVYSTNFLPSQVVYTPVSNNAIDVYISGLTSENLNWTSYYNIVGQNCGSSFTNTNSSSGNFTGNTSATCISDIYVSNIHSCSPLYINPNDEGNIYFGSNNQITIDLSNGILSVNGILSATTLYGSGFNITDIPISAVTSLDSEFNLKTNLSDFVSHTGNTNNPHQTSFSQLTSTAHTHTISDIINLQSSLDSKFSNSGGTVNGNVIINGNVQILGSATTINTQTLSIADNVVTLNSNYTGNTAPFFGHSGIEVLRGSGTTAALLWEEQRLQWEAGLHGSTKKIIVEGDSLALLTSGHTHPISEINGLQNSLNNKFETSGGTITNNVTIIGTLSATTYYGNGQFLTGISATDNFVTGGTFNSVTNTLTLNRQNGSVTITGFTSSGGGGGGTFTGGTVSGPTNFIGGLSANSLTVSGTTTLYSVSANTTPFVIKGKQGELFSVTDSLIGSLFSVNDISGLSVLDVYSDSTILMGVYAAPSLNTTRRVLVNAGQSNIYSIPTSAYTGGFFDYTVANGVNLRAGNIMSVWSSSNINYVENSTSDLGNTSGLVFDMVVSGGFATLRASANTNSWIVKTIVRSI